MDSKVLRSYLILVLVLLAIALAACSDSTEMESIVATPQSTGSVSQLTEVVATPQSSPSVETNWLEVVYFHRTNRCKSCIYAEDQTIRVIETYFGDELANGTLIFQVFDLQDEANSEMVDKYNAHSSSLFTNEVKAGTESIQGIDDIWTKIGRDEAFTEVVKTRIEECLGNT